MQKFDWQWPPAVIFCVVFLVIGYLVHAGRLHPEALMAILTWLAPSPYQGNQAPKKDP